METPDVKNLLDSGNTEKLDGLNKLQVKAVESETQSRKLFEPGPDKPKNKGGRPKKNPQDAAKPQNPPPGPQPTVQVIPGFDARDAAKQLFSMASAMLVRSTRCNEMALLPEEIDGLGNSWGMVANHYLPSVLGQYGDIISALTITAMVGFRISQVAEVEIQKRQKARQASAETVNEAARPETPKPQTATNDPFSGFPSDVGHS